MKRVVILVLVLALLGGVFYLSFNNDNENNTVDTGQDEPEDIGENDNKGEENIEEGNNEEENLDQGDLVVGKAPPAFTLKDLDDNDVSLSDYKGQIVVLNFWATWCTWCDVEMPDLKRYNDENDDLTVVAVNVEEDKETVEKYLTEGGYDFDVVLDENGQVARDYLVSGYPSTYFIDKDGLLIGLYPGMMTWDMMNHILDGIREEYNY